MFSSPCYPHESLSPPDLFAQHAKTIPLLTSATFPHLAMDHMLHTCGQPYPLLLRRSSNLPAVLHTQALLEKEPNAQISGLNGRLEKSFFALLEKCLFVCEGGDECRGPAGLMGRVETKKVLGRGGCWSWREQMGGEGWPRGAWRLCGEVWVAFGLRNCCNRRYCWKSILF